jgi:hypothetical protein
MLLLVDFAVLYWHSRKQWLRITRHGGFVVVLVLPCEVAYVIFEEKFSR